MKHYKVREDGRGFDICKIDFSGEKPRFRFFGKINPGDVVTILGDPVILPSWDEKEPWFLVMAGEKIGWVANYIYLTRGTPFTPPTLVPLAQEDQP